MQVSQRDSSSECKATFLEGVNGFASSAVHDFAKPMCELVQEALNQDGHHDHGSYLTYMEASPLAALDMCGINGV